MVVKFSKNVNKVVYAVLLLLLVAVVALVLLNRGDPELRRALSENREFMILADGQHIATVNLQLLLDMDPVEFSTTFSTSATAARDVVLRGVELRTLLDSLDIDVSDADYFLVSGLDAYYSPLSRDEVEKAETVYICFSMGGEVLKPQDEGGYGPFMMVIRGSRFAQRWCKYVESVDVRSR